MDKLTEIALKEIGNIDSILSNSSDKVLKLRTKDLIDAQFHSLFSNVDSELKKDEKLNQLINDLIEMKKVLNYDVRNYFEDSEYVTYYGEDVHVGNVFNEERFEFAKKHVANWQSERKVLEDKISKLKNGHLKFLTGGILSRYEEKLASGDRNYERFKKIFDEEKVMKAVDKEKLEADFYKKFDVVRGTISSVIDKNILESIKENPSIVCFDKFCKEGKGYSFISTSENSNENNKNIYKYFDSREINDKLRLILEAYNKEKAKNAELASYGE